MECKGQHYPVVRPTAADESAFEIVCRQCGDTGEPGDHLSPEIAKLRGPYLTEQRAKDVAPAHANETWERHRQP